MDKIATKIALETLAEVIKYQFDNIIKEVLTLTITFPESTIERATKSSLCSNTLNITMAQFDKLYNGDYMFLTDGTNTYPFLYKNDTTICFGYYLGTDGGKRYEITKNTSVRYSIYVT